MKKLGLIIIAFILASNIYAQSYAGFSRLINIEAGYKFISNNLGIYHVGALEVNYHAPLLYTTYSLRAELGKGYWSVEPLSAIGLAWMIGSQATGDWDYYAPILKLSIVCLAGSSMKFPIRIYYGMFELCPSYSLLRWTLGDFTGALGLSFNYYINKYLYLHSRGEFNWSWSGYLGLGYSVQFGLGVQIPIDK